MASREGRKTIWCQAPAPPPRPGRGPEAATQGWTVLYGRHVISAAFSLSSARCLPHIAFIKDVYPDVLEEPEQTIRGESFHAEIAASFFVFFYLKCVRRG